MILEPQNGRANEPRCGSSSAPSSFMLFFRETHWEVSSSESIFGDIRHTWFVRKHIRLALAKAQAPLASKRWYTVMYAAATAWGSTNQAALKPARKARYWLPTMRRYKGSADGLFPVDAVSQSPSLFSTLSILRPLYNSFIHDKCMHEWLHKVSNPMRKRWSKYSTCSLFMSLPPVCLKGPRFALSIFSPWPWSRIKPWNPTAPRRCRMPIHAKVCQSWLASVEDFGLGMTTLAFRPSLGVSKDTFASLCLFGHKNKSSMRHWQSILGILEYLYIYIYMSFLASENLRSVFTGPVSRKMLLSERGSCAWQRGTRNESTEWWPGDVQRLFGTRKPIQDEFGLIMIDHDSWLIWLIQLQYLRGWIMRCAVLA